MEAMCIANKHSESISNNNIIILNRTYRVMESWLKLERKRYTTDSLLNIKSTLLLYPIRNLQYGRT